MPPQMRQLMSNSKPGSTKGKNPGRRRTLMSLRKTSESMVFMKKIRLEMEISLPTITPSIWKKVFSWQASVDSFRKHLPGKIALMGVPSLMSRSLYFL